jgi:uncharacterized protein YdeI (YjbR/CyaY-like superfamily)
MGTLNPYVTKYIATAAPFAQPILTYIREVMHAACPNVEESMKWSRPHFSHQGMIAGMSAFKAHCALSFWKAELIFGSAAADGDGMGQFGRITSLADLPPKRTLIGYVKKAVQLNKDGVAAPRMVRSKTPRPVVVPEVLRRALGQSTKARKAFDALSPSHQREYCEWIDEAKRPATVATRVEKTIAQLSDGKSLNWKYEGQTP